VKILKGKLIFVSIIPESDKKIEVIISKDPVASDKTTLNILRKKNLLKNSLLKSFEKQIMHGSKLGIGNEDSKQEDIAY